MDRAAEIALQEPLEEDHELDRDRLVQTKLGIDPRHRLVGRPLAQDGTRRITGQQPHQDKHDHHDEQAAAALPPDLPALGVIEDVLEGLYGVRPLRVAMGATIPIGGIFQRTLGIQTVFFSFSTADEDFHGPNEFFRLESFRTGLTAWARVLEALGARLGGATRR
jgi:acetylornithine deacetylase/succinyl-diaminopimelate desuccinylase-like protein